MQQIADKVNIFMTSLISIRLRSFNMLSNRDQGAHCCSIKFCETRANPRNEWTKVMPLCSDYTTHLAVCDKGAGPVQTYISRAHSDGCHYKDMLRVQAHTTLFQIDLSNITIKFGGSVKNVGGI